jgi:transposase
MHVIARVQIRLPDHPGRVYYERKRAEGKTHRAALRALKRQLATIAYYRLRDESALTTAYTPVSIASAV